MLFILHMSVFSSPSAPHCHNVDVIQPVKAWWKTCLMSVGGLCLYLYLPSFVLCTSEFMEPIFGLLLFSECKCSLCYSMLSFCRLQLLKAYMVQFRLFQQKRSQRNLSSLDLTAFGWLYTFYQLAHVDC